MKAFFDTVNHDRLLNQLRDKIGSDPLLRLIGRYVEDELKLSVNRIKSKSGSLAQSQFLGFQINRRGAGEVDSKSTHEV